MLRKLILVNLLYAVPLLAICQNTDLESKKETTIVKTLAIDVVSVEDSLYLYSILNKEYGIALYANLNYRLGGDSLRHDKKGYAARGWVEDCYPSGKLIHRGYYSDGCLKIYKNFYPSGITERSFKTIDNISSTMERYYLDGILASKILYKRGIPIKGEDYYPDGNLKYMEEFDKTLDYYLARKSFYPNGKLQELLLLVKEPKRLYEHKKYNDAGVLIESGKTIYSETNYDYQKIGKWVIYDDAGNPIKEKNYEKGKITKEKTL